MGGFRSISSRFSLALTAVVATLLVAFAAVVILINMHRAETRLEYKLLTYLKVTEVALRVPMWNLDYETGQGVINSLLSDEQVTFAEVSVTTDNLTLRASRDVDDQSFDYFATATGFNTGKIDITNNGETVGTLKLALSRGVGLSETITEVVGIVLLTALLIAAIAATSILTSRRYIARPLQKLKESASSIARGNLDTIVNVNRNDEIGLLAQDLNEMRQSVKSLFDDLQAANSGLEHVNQTLEDRVVDRTKALTETTNTFREILEYCPAGLCIVNEDELLVYSNTTFRNMFEYSEQEIRNVNTSSFWQDLEQRRAVRTLLTANKDKLLNHEVILKSRSGKQIAGLISFTQTLNKVDQLGFSKGSRVVWFYDISKLKQAEEAQRQSEQRLIDALESIGEGFAFYDENDNLVLNNTRHRELLYDGADIDLSPGSNFEQNLRDAVEVGLIEDAKEDPNNWITARLKKHRNPDGPVIQHRKGNRWLMINERKVAGGGTVAVFSDLTELKRREAEAEESEARLQAILDYAPVLVFVKDLEGRYLLTNRAFNEFWGHSEGGIVGKTDHDLYSKNQADSFHESDHKMLSSGEAVKFEDTQYFHGKRRSSVVNKFPLRNQSGEIYAISAITSDVTEMIEREEELRRTADRLELALSMDGVGIWDAHLENNTVWWSHNYTQLLKYDPETFTPSATTWEEILHPDNAQEVISRVNTFLESKQTRLRVLARMMRADGTSIWVDSLMHVRRDESGNPLVLSGLDLDVTEQLQREHKLSDANRQLETLSTKLSKYLSPQVYNSIFSGKQEVRLASKRKKLTVMFSDIVGFTEATEQMESEDLTVLINQYLTEMSEIALAYGATIDKYIGDAIMIYFGDPESRGVKNDAIFCVEMAIEMQQRLHGLALHLRATGIENPLQCRIGISTGYCTVGNFGSNDRMDYTILGSGVNLASRLEQNCEAGGILIAYETHALVKDRIPCEEVGKIKVKGLSNHVSTYKVCTGDLNHPADHSLLQADLPNFKLDLHPTQMSASERAKALEIAEEIIKRLRERHESAKSKSTIVNKSMATR